MPDSQQNLERRAVCWRYVEGMWEVCGRYVGGMWEACGRYVRGAWRRQVLRSCSSTHAQPKKESEVPTTHVKSSKAKVVGLHVTSAITAGS